MGAGGTVLVGAAAEVSVVVAEPQNLDTASGVVQPEKVASNAKAMKIRRCLMMPPGQGEMEIITTQQKNQLRVKLFKHIIEIERHFPF